MDSGSLACQDKTNCNPLNTFHDRKHISGSFACQEKKYSGIWQVGKGTVVSRSL